MRNTKRVVNVISLLLLPLIPVKEVINIQYQLMKIHKR